MINAIVPVALGGRYQNVTGTTIKAIVPSDSTPVGPCVQIVVGGAGNLSLVMWDGTTQVIPVVAGQTVVASPKFIAAATTATGLFIVF